MREGGTTSGQKLAKNRLGWEWQAVGTSLNHSVYRQRDRGEAGRQTDLQNEFQDIQGYIKTPQLKTNQTKILPPWSLISFLPPMDPLHITYGHGLYYSKQTRTEYMV